MILVFVEANEHNNGHETLYKLLQFAYEHGVLPESRQ